MKLLIGQVFPYLALVLFLAAAIHRTVSWSTAPRKLKWKLYPVPHTRAEELKLMGEEIFSFRSLFLNNRLLWPGSYCFHLALLGLLLWFILFMAGIVVPWLVRAAAVLMIASTLYILALRTFVPQLKALSSVTEYLNLILFLLIALTGLLCLGKGLGTEVRSYYLGLLSGPAGAHVPESGIFLFHLLLLETLLAYLPSSRMFHIVSKYFTFHGLKWKNPGEEIAR